MGGTQNPSTQTNTLLQWDKSKQKALQCAADFMQMLKGEIRNTQNGDPLGYLDPALITDYYGRHSGSGEFEHKQSEPDPIQTPGLMLQTLDVGLQKVNDEVHCYLPLRYLDGYPSTVFGNPYWERLDSEPLDYYDLFCAYRNDTHIIQLQDQAVSDEDKNKGSNKYIRYPMQHEKSLRTSRSLYKIADRANIDRQTLFIISVLYHWHDRVKAYDKYQEVQLARQRSAEIQYMSNMHTQAARSIFNKALEFLEAHQEDLNPKTALEWFQTAVALERLSLGLPKDAPPGEEGIAGNDRRAWVQVNVNAANESASIGINPANPNGTEPSTREARIESILRTLQQARAIDVTPEEILEGGVPA